MRKILLAVITLHCICHSFAQTNTDFRSKAGEAFIPSPYRFPDFIQGFVRYKNGNNTTAKLNFNMANQEMHFMSSNGDTLAIDKPMEILSIVLDTTVYYSCKEGYLEVFSRYDSILLTAKLRLKNQNDKIGAYGQPNPSSSIDNYRSFIDHNRVYSLTTREHVTFSYDVTIYFVDNKHQAFKATKANLFKMFPGKKGEIEKYLRQHPVNFNNRTDMEQLVSYVTGLYNEL